MLQNYRKENVPESDSCLIRYVNHEMKETDFELTRDICKWPQSFCAYNFNSARKYI